MPSTMFWISLCKKNSNSGRAGVISITKQESVASNNEEFDGAGPGVCLDLDPSYTCDKCNRGYDFYGCLLGSSLLSGLGKKLFGPSVDSKFVSMRKAYSKCNFVNTPALESAIAIFEKGQLCQHRSSQNLDVGTVTFFISYMILRPGDDVFRGRFWQSCIFLYQLHVVHQLGAQIVSSPGNALSRELDEPKVSGVHVQARFQRFSPLSSSRSDECRQSKWVQTILFDWNRRYWKYEGAEFGVLPVRWKSEARCD